MKNITKIYLLILILFVMKAEAKVIYDFSLGENSRKWQIVDDGVMGGRSRGVFKVDKYGNGIFSGYISLDNYGGFSSIRLRTKAITVNDHKSIAIRLYGDNKFYQLRIKASQYDRHVYAKKFFAKDGWQEIIIPLSAMEPQYRGRRLRMKKFNSNLIMEIGILIGNKVEEEFLLKIDNIKLI